MGRRPRQRRPSGSERDGPRPSEPVAAPRPLWRLLTAQDVRDHPFQVVFIVLTLLATLVAPPIAVAVSTVRLAHATTEVSGTVVDVSVRKSSRGRSRTLSTYTYEYRVDGTPYRGAFTTRGRPLLKESAPVRLFVDPAVPHRSYHERELVSISLTLTFFFWGVAALLVCLRQVPSGRDLLRPRYAWAFALVFTPVSFFTTFATPPERWWLIPLRYVAVLAVTGLWLHVRWKRR